VIRILSIQSNSRNLIKAIDESLAFKSSFNLFHTATPGTAVYAVSSFRFLRVIRGHLSIFDIFSDDIHVHFVSEKMDQIPRSSVLFQVAIEKSGRFGYSLLVKLCFYLIILLKRYFFYHYLIFVISGEALDYCEVLG